jgi:hypothetical protein
MIFKMTHYQQTPACPEVMGQPGAQEADKPGDQNPSSHPKSCHTRAPARAVDAFADFREKSSLNLRT